MKPKEVPRRGDVYIARLDPTHGREIKKTRPVVVISNNHLNELSGLVIVAPITSGKYSYVHDIPIIPPDGGLEKNSVIVVEQLRAIDQTRLMKQAGRVKKTTLEEIDQALRDHLGLTGSRIL
ncbi:MAG: type II toxin-antitoxin system PemK/MazF family toxin [Thermodesulfobacteriota bacterium]